MTVCEDYTFQKQFFAAVDQSKIQKLHHEVQYDFFLEPEESEIEMLRKDLAIVKASGHAVRRGTYAMINEQKKQITELEERLKHIERGLCYGK